eukprot:scaffold24082_cov74-Phaeocystis_antarctica.AAC.2
MGTATRYMRGGFVSWACAACLDRGKLSLRVSFLPVPRSDAASSAAVSRSARCSGDALGEVHEAEAVVGVVSPDAAATCRVLRPSSGRETRRLRPKAPVKTKGVRLGLVTPAEVTRTCGGGRGCVTRRGLLGVCALTAAQGRALHPLGYTP